MRLTKYQKDAIIRSIWDAVPEVDDSPAIQQALVDSMSEPCQKLYKLAPKALRQTDLYSWEFRLGVYSGVVAVGDGNLDVLEPFRQRARDRAKVKDKLKATVNSCSTLKQLYERLPEFAKHFPDEVEKSRNLPVVTSVAADLKKLGWPK